MNDENLSEDWICEDPDSPWYGQGHESYGYLETMYRYSPTNPPKVNEDLRKKNGKEKMKQFDYIKSTKQMIKGHDFLNGYFYKLLNVGEGYSYDKEYPTYFSRRDEQEFLFLHELYKTLLDKEEYEEIMDEFDINPDFTLCDGYLPNVVDKLIKEVIKLRKLNE